MRLPGRADFQGNERFEILSRLGDGGMGVVYEALDRERQMRVALKTLRTLSADGVLRFKNEFRSLQDLQHPNLVTLGELIEDGGQWFFTMELVDGIDFLSFVRPPADPPARGTRLHAARLRNALVQLARGLVTLHAAKKVHRDIKPSNILVTREERVVLVDFGLSAEISGSRQTSDGHVVGTADYMAPEQAASSPPGPEADWYSVGTILYEALTNRLPYRGTPIGVLLEKQKQDPPAPSSLPGVMVPGDLETLCMDLLKRDPRARPSGIEVLRRLGADDPVAARQLRSSLGLPPFVGRHRELTMLGDAIEEARRGEPVLVIVEGESGVGKSALVKRFTESLEDEALVLSGRCYERELVPFKAFDGVVDALSRHLMELPNDEVAPLLPPRVALLGQIFPVLRSVEAISRAPLPTGSAEPQETRTRVFQAVRQLLVALSATRPLVIVIDDLQWADEDSLALLTEVMRPPDAPRVLLVATERNDSHRRRTRFAISARRLSLERLGPEEAGELASALAARAGVPAPPVEIAREAAGHPLFIDALVRHTADEGELSSELHLDDVLWRRIERLDRASRLLVELVAVAGAPIAQETAARAATLEGSDFAKHVAILRVSNLVRTAGARGSDGIETYHDRVRQAVMGRLMPTDLLQLHERLALALAAARHADPEALCVHWLGAGDLDKAAVYAALAADQASTALAFERAARLYRLSIELVPRLESPLRRIKLADALAQAGRGADAARAYLRAAEVANPAVQLDLKRRAAEQFLRAGHFAEGQAALESVLSATGMHLARTPTRALASLVAKRARLRLRGLSFKERDESQIPVEELRRIDLCWSVAVGLALVDTIRGADFQTRHLLLALGAGEPYRVARALAVEGGMNATTGGPARARSQRLLEEARMLAERIGHPHALGLATLMSGVSAFLQGRWAEAQPSCDAAAEILAERCTGVAWELHNAHYIGSCALAMQGRFAEVTRRMGPLRRGAEERGDLFAGSTLRIGLLNLAALAAGEPARARDEIVEAMRPWAERSFQFQHYSQLVAEVQTDLYEGDGGRALERLDEIWPKLRAAMVLRTQFFRIEAHDLRARAALLEATKKSGTDRKRLCAIASGEAQTILGEKDAPWSVPLAHLIEASVRSLQRSDPARVLSLLEQAERGFAAAEMHLHAACARRRRGEISATDGDALRASATAWMSAESIRDPARMTELFAPGWR